MYTELRAWLSYTRDDRPLTFRRTRHGKEVDFVVGDDLAIEVKAHPVDRHPSGLPAIADEGPFRRRLLVCDGDAPPRITDGIEILPVNIFLERLWAGEWSV